jgi:hypothetical protein
MFLHKFEMSSEQLVELLTANSKWRTALLRPFAGIPRIQVKDCQQGSFGPKRAHHGPDIFRTLPGIDDTKTSVFENPVKLADQFRRELEEIRQLIGFRAGAGKPASLFERARRYVQPNHLSGLRSGRYSADVVSRATAGYEYFALQWPSVRKPFEKRRPGESMSTPARHRSHLLFSDRRGRTFFPRGITRSVSPFPIHGWTSLSGNLIFQHR